ncbi:MAG: ADP-ribosylglycohydrolase family protein [Chloroflexota bacterium]|nr:ADP-ribosylglycohydrolase family protein [Chloroflexota bacterium]
MRISYDEYYDHILGGWIGKSMGGAVGARFEGYKDWIEISPQEMFPEELPPNDDLDIQVLWLKVLEERGAAITSDDMAEAWLKWCWYPFNEYGTFRRNWRLKIHAPDSGRYDNEFWETGEGCPIRSEIWGYVFPDAPDLAARYAEMDGTLDHSEQSVGAEKMLSAMASMAFFLPDVRRLAENFIHYLPPESRIERLTRAAFQAYDDGLSLRDARQRLLALGGHPEACDSRLNIPFTFLGLLYGENNLEQTLLSALKCGYDTDCTLASSGALIGQILGASRIPDALKDPIGDQLVMGIEYNREEMTLSALARDTARVGALLAEELKTGVTFTDSPPLAPFPAAAVPPRTSMRVEYDGLPCAAPGRAVSVTIHASGELPSEGAELSINAPPGWESLPKSAIASDKRSSAHFVLRPRADLEALPMRNIFTARLSDAALRPQAEETSYEFGVAGAGLWKLLGVYFDPLPPEDRPELARRKFQHHFVALEKEYIAEPRPDVDALFKHWSHLLGKPAVIVSSERRIDPSQVIGLQGEYCIYCARTVISPAERDAYFVVGNNDGFRIYLNGEKVMECEEQTWWTPFNHATKVHLRKGENVILVKLLKRGERLDFSFGIREYTPDHKWRPGGGHNVEDWVVDTSDRNPLVDL